jgi:hypothetical protein
MKRVCIGLLVLGVFLGLSLLLLRQARAMPEYAATVSEPCATCHISPSGGGLRTPRGMGWVAAGKPGQVPTLEEALKLLGVTLPPESGAYTAPPGPQPTPAPLSSQPAGQNLPAWLRQHAGN